MTNFVLGKNTRENLESLYKAKNVNSKILIKAVEEFIHVTPIDFCIIENGGFRTAFQQGELYAKGHSKCDGERYKSQHQLGLAVDLVPWVDNSMTWAVKECFYLAGAFMAFCEMKGYKITSGADWNADGNIKDGWDPCHMEVKE